MFHAASRKAWYYQLVVSTHLKNMLVKLDHFQFLGGETQKNVWKKPPRNRIIMGIISDATYKDPYPNNMSWVCLVLGWYSLPIVGHLLRSHLHRPMFLLPKVPERRTRGRGRPAKAIPRCRWCYGWWFRNPARKHTWDVENPLWIIGYLPWNPVNNGINCQTQLVSRISEPSTVW